MSMSVGDLELGTGQSFAGSDSVNWQGHCIKALKFCKDYWSEVVGGAIILSGAGVLSYGLLFSAQAFSIAGGTSVGGGIILELAIRNFRIKKSWDSLIQENKKTNERYQHLVLEMGELNSKLETNVQTLESQNGLLLKATQASEELVVKLQKSGDKLGNDVLTVLDFLKKFQEDFHQVDDHLKIIKGLTDQTRSLLKQVGDLQLDCRNSLKDAKTAADREEKAEQREVELRNQMVSILNKMEYLLDNIPSQRGTSSNAIKKSFNEFKQMLRPHS